MSLIGPRGDAEALRIDFVLLQPCIDPVGPVRLVSRHTNQVSPWFAPLIGSFDSNIMLKSNRSQFPSIGPNPPPFATMPAEPYPLASSNEQSGEAIASPSCLTGVAAGLFDLHDQVAAVIGATGELGG